MKVARKPVTTPHSPPQMLRLSTVAKCLDCSKSQVYELFHAGVLPGARIGGMLRISERGLAEYLEGQMNRDK